jgi:hypothetical protein
MSRPGNTICGSKAVFRMLRRGCHILRELRSQRLSPLTDAALFS